MGIWEAVAERGSAVTFAPGDVLLHHGEVSEHCYALLSGEVLVSASSSTGSTVALGRRGPGTVIGEIGALDGEPRSATVRAITEVRAVVLSSAQLSALLIEQPELAVAMVKRLSSQLRELTERYAVRGEELKARLVQLLRTNAAETGDPTFRSTREELSNWVGATREAVTRTLSEMESEGVVRLRRGAVELLGV